MKITGIYKILNIVTGKFYIGSAVHIYHRWTTHAWHLNNGTHPNKYLQNAWNKYGPDKFNFIILEVCEKKFLSVKEQGWLDWTKCYDRELGYNLYNIAGSPLGTKWTEERKLRQSERMKNFRHTEEAKQRMKGRIKSEEEIFKVAQAKIGKPRSEETKIKIGNANRGRTRNRDLINWPCPDGGKCKCRQCKDKRNLQLKNWMKQKNKYYEIVNV